jgi:hypothetical protein
MRYYKEGEILLSPTVPNVINPTHEQIVESGWFEFIDKEPKIDYSLSRVLKTEVINGVQNYEIVPLTALEIRNSSVPLSITPAQGRMMLLQMGLLTRVKEAVKNSTDEALIIFWEYALSWDRDNIHIAAMAGMLEMNEEQTDDFFIEANKT